MYADDLVIISPSVAGLAKLLNICEAYGVSLDIIYNYQKSAIMIFRSKHLKCAQLPSFMLSGEMLQEVKEVKYLGHIIRPLMMLIYAGNVKCLKER